MNNDREFFELHNGRVIMDDDLSDKMYTIKSFHPERASDNSSGFEWSEMGMANLFGTLYNKARYCAEHKSWYTYVTQGTPYTGAYSVTSKSDGDFMLKTNGLIMTNDLTVKKIPYYQVENPSSGDTVYIGSEVI